ncbi:MAG TPA: SRPBCC family protein [Acetobacteraceae bacterium]|nr:SRPBCC family protein [Acetobacteraceae bacterium]
MADAQHREGAQGFPSLAVSRTFAAPRGLVFQAWSSAEHIKRWFSPEQYTVPEAEVDFRPGGMFAVCMRAPDGTDTWCRGTFTDVVPPERLGFVVGIPDREAPRFVAHTTVVFEDVAGGTRMTVRQSYEIFDPEFRRAAEGAEEGWRTTLDKFEVEVTRLLAETPRAAVHGSFTVERVYPSAPPVVFRALTDMAAKARWFTGDDTFQVIERVMDVRAGGRERLKGRWGSGLVTTFDAVYFDVVANQRLVYAYEMHLDARKISVSLATMQLHPAGEGTRLTVTEQGTFLDGYDDAGAREKGTGLLLDRLGASISTQRF